jgi:tetratricopeptide (TPR) repeat protein
LSPEQSGVLEKGAAAGETQIPPAVQGLGEAILQMGTSGQDDEDIPADPDAPGVFPNPPDPALDTPFEEPRRIGPEDGMAQAEAALDHDQAPEAARILAQLVEAQPKRLEARLLLADVHLFHLNSPKEAKAGYEAVLRIEPRNKRALNNLGVLHLEQGRLGEAEKKFSLALEVDKTYVDPLFNLACVAARSQKTSLALSYLDRARRLDPQVAGWAAQDKDLQSLRGQPAFDRLVKESRP